MCTLPPSGMCCSTSRRPLPQCCCWWCACTMPGCRGPRRWASPLLPPPRPLPWCLPGPGRPRPRAACCLESWGWGGGGLLPPDGSGGRGGSCLHGRYCPRPAGCPRCSSRSSCSRCHQKRLSSGSSISSCCPANPGIGGGGTIVVADAGRCSSGGAGPASSAGATGTSISDGTSLGGGGSPGVHIGSTSARMPVSASFPAPGACRSSNVTFMGRHIRMVAGQRWCASSARSRSTVPCVDADADDDDDDEGLSIAAAQWGAWGRGPMSSS